MGFPKPPVLDREECPVRKAIALSSVLLLLVPAALARQGGLAPEILERGKRATVLVEVAADEGTYSGSAFCIDTAGYFVTNNHVIAPPGGARRITLVLCPGEVDQKLLLATVVRADATADLAIIRAQDPGQFVPLRLGDSDILTETMQVVAFGYPFGRQLATT